MRLVAVSPFISGMRQIEKYQIHRIRGEKLDSLLPACRGENPFFKQYLPTFQHTRCVIYAEDHWFPRHSRTPILSAGTLFLKK